MNQLPMPALLERCVPGVSPSWQPEPEQDEVITGLLRRLWIEPVPGSQSRYLAGGGAGTGVPIQRA